MTRQCFTDGCDNAVERADLFTCGRCWSGAVRMCRGKKRQDVVQATMIEFRQRRRLQAYECPVCGYWHNGHPNPEVDVEAVRESVRSIVRELRERRGNEWVDELIRRWDPAAGYWSRGQVAA